MTSMHATNNDALSTGNSLASEVSETGIVERSRGDLVWNLFEKEYKNPPDNVDLDDTFDSKNVSFKKVDVPEHKFVRTFSSSFNALQEWEGSVLEVNGETFTASLIDTKAKHPPEVEEADFLLSDVSLYDQNMVKPGAIFRWVIGYTISKGGNRKRSSVVSFRRLPQWTKKELQESRSRAKEISDSINWE